jgi:hypothetical protein
LSVNGAEALSSEISWEAGITWVSRVSSNQDRLASSGERRRVIEKIFHKATWRKLNGR